jgi:hypothetical protein
MDPTPNAVRPTLGLEPGHLDLPDLFRELAHLCETRLDTLRHGSDSALAHHDRRMAELEREYLRRFPDREVDPARLS